MYTVKITAKFQRDVKRAEKRGYNLSLLTSVVKMLADGKELPLKYKDHELTGDFTSFRECHITPDWLLVYKIDRNQLILVLSRTGTHSDLF